MNKKDLTPAVIEISAFSKTWRTVAATLLALYIISPIDLINDIFLPFGLMDDLVSAFLFYLTVKKIYRENLPFFKKMLAGIGIFVLLCAITFIYLFFFRDDDININTNPIEKVMYETHSSEDSI